MRSRVNWIARIGIVSTVVAVTLPLRAHEESQAEELPPPKAEGAQTVVPERTLLFVPYPRISRYEVWQFYGADRFGRFRPRVVLSPYGSYYLYNCRVYPWVTTHQLDFMRDMVD